MQKGQIFQRGTLKTYIIGSVPSYESLDVTCKDKNEVFIFIDFNNMIKGLYYPKMLEMILNQIQMNNGVFPSILINEWMILQNYLEQYAKSRNINKFHVVYFSEGGQSYYHKNILKNYKNKRKNALFQLPPSVSNNYKSYDDINDLIRGFLVSSWKWIEIISKQSNILSIRLENLDADFIPELLLRKFNIYDDEAVYIILSSDGDMLQTLDIADNIYIYNGNEIISDKNWIKSKSYLDPYNKKNDNIDTKDSSEPIILIENNDKYSNITPDKIILFKALVGDTSDNIPGIKGVGVKGFFEKFINIIPGDVRADDIDEIENICKNNMEQNKICAKIIHDFDTFKNMIRLVSFKMLINWLQLNQQRYSIIQNIIEQNKNALINSCNFLEIKNKNNQNSNIFLQNSELKEI